MITQVLKSLLFRKWAEVGEKVQQAGVHASHAGGLGLTLEPRGPPSGQPGETPAKTAPKFFQRGLMQQYYLHVTYKRRINLIIEITNYKANDVILL